MSKVKFSKEDNGVVVGKIQQYFQEHLHPEIGAFDAEFLLNFMSEAFGTYYYNQGLTDVQTLLRGKMESITDAIAELEKPLAFD